MTKSQLEVADSSDIVSFMSAVQLSVFSIVINILNTFCYHFVVSYFLAIFVCLSCLCILCILLVGPHL